MNWITDKMQGATFGGSKSTRKISKDSPMQEIDDHRYTLWHRFEEGAPLSEMVAFIGLNPSTAVPGDLDRTVSKCEHYAKSWGFKGFVMLNLFSYRATYPGDMLKYEHESPSFEAHRINGSRIIHVCSTCKMTVCCWGNGGSLFSIGERTLEILLRRGLNARALAINATGEPKHPLYHKKNVRLGELVKLV